MAFAVETGDRLSSGEPLAAAVERLDAETAAGAEYLMVVARICNELFPA